MDKLLENVLNNALRSNPQAMNMIAEYQKSGMSAKDFFYKKTEEMGVNPDDILKILQGFK